MRSRYDLAQDSSQVSGDGTYYPDVFTIPIQKFRYTEHPKEHFLTERDINREDIFIYEEYGVSELDDIVFWLNDIGYIGDKSAGDQILIPKKEDVETFYYKHRE